MDGVEKALKEKVEVSFQTRFINKCNEIGLTFKLITGEPNTLIVNQRNMIQLFNKSNYNLNLDGIFKQGFEFLTDYEKRLK